MISYLNYFKLRMITNLQYKSAAIAGVLTQLFFGFFYIFMYLAFYNSNDVNTPMSFSSLVTYLWLHQAFFSLTYPYKKDNELLKMITNGDLAYELVRPQDFYLKFFIKMLAERYIAVLLRAPLVLLVALILPAPINLVINGDPITLILFIVSLFISSLLVVALCLFVHILVVYVIDSRGLFTTYGMIAELFMGAIIPIPFLPKVFKVITDYLPFKYLNDLPFRLYTGDISINDGITGINIALIWLIVSIILGYLTSKNILRKAVIQGG